MKKMKRSELIGNNYKYIGYKIYKNIKNHHDEIYYINYIQGCSDYRYDFLTSDLIYYDLDHHEDSDEAIELLDKGEEIKISYDFVGRDGCYEDDNIVDIMVMDYQELKKYYELFKSLLEQDIYDSERLKEKLENELEENNNKKELRSKI